MAHYLLKSILRKHASIIMSKMVQGVEAQEAELVKQLARKAESKSVTTEDFREIKKELSEAEKAEYLAGVERMAQEEFMEVMAEALDMLREVDEASKGKLTSTMMRMAALGIIKDFEK